MDRPDARPAIAAWVTIMTTLGVVFVSHKAWWPAAVAWTGAIVVPFVALWLIPKFIAHRAPEPQTPPRDTGGTGIPAEKFIGLPDMGIQIREIPKDGFDLKGPNYDLTILPPSQDGGGVA